MLNFTLPDEGTGLDLWFQVACLLSATGPPVPSPGNLSRSYRRNRRESGCHEDRFVTL